MIRSLNTNALVSPHSSAPYEGRSIFLNAEDRLQKRIVIPYTFNETVGNLIAKTAGSDEEGALNKFQKHTINQVIKQLNTDPDINKMYRFVYTKNPDIFVQFSKSQIRINPAYGNLLTFRSMRSARQREVLGTSPAGTDGHSNAFLCMPRFSPMIWGNQNLTQQTILHELGHCVFGLKHPVQRETSDKPPFIADTPDVLETSVMVSKGDDKHRDCVLEKALSTGKGNRRTKHGEIYLSFSTYEPFALDCFNRWPSRYTKFDLRAIADVYQNKIQDIDVTQEQSRPRRDEL